MSQPRNDLILRHLDALPRLPAAAGRALALAARVDIGRRDVLWVLRGSSGLTKAVKQLWQVPQCHRGAGGTTRLASAIIAPVVIKVLGPARGDELSKELWTHGVAVASAAELLVMRLGSPIHGRRAGSATRARAAAELDALEAFVCGLVHDAGKIALHTALPRSYARVVKAANSLCGDIAEVERQILGIDHHTAGAYVADRWKLPSIMRHVIALHNQRPAIFEILTSAGEHARMIMLISLADSLARSARLGYSGNHTYGMPLELLTRPLGLRSGDLEAVSEQLVEHTIGRARLLGLERAPGELYRAAIKRAASDMSHMHRRAALAQDYGRSLASLAALAAEMDPEASVADVLASVALAMADAMQCGTLATYALHAGLAHVAVKEGQALEHRRLAAPRIKQPLRDERGIEPAGADLEWLAQACSPKLRGGRRWHLPLCSGGQRIGGIYFGGGADEPNRLAPQLAPLEALRTGCALALRIALVREEAARTAAELGETNRRLAMAQDQIAQDRAVLCVAELAAGAAHEMNNPLMVISGRSQLLAQRLTDERDRQSALAIHQNAQRLSDMITSLMRYARPNAADPQPLDVQELFARVMTLVADIPERRGRDIQWIAPPLPAVRADCVQIARALAALLENALQASEAGGRVEVAAALDAAHENVVITVFDSGVGMDATTLSRAFDPFFSAKSAGRRRGMGLAVALRLIEANDGSLRLDSRLGAGTRSVVTLPVAQSKAQIAPQAIRKSA